jgi:hypothetical protein
MNARFAERIPGDFVQARGVGDEMLFADDAREFIQQLRHRFRL